MLPIAFKADLLAITCTEAVISLLVVAKQARVSSSREMALRIDAQTGECCTDERCPITPPIVEDNR